MHQFCFVDGPTLKSARTSDRGRALRSYAVRRGLLGKRFIYSERSVQPSSSHAPSADFQAEEEVVEQSKRVDKSRLNRIRIRRHNHCWSPHSIVVTMILFQHCLKMLGLRRSWITVSLFTNQRTWLILLTIAASTRCTASVGGIPNHR
jgi:hypothetical protein